MYLVNSLVLIWAIYKRIVRLQRKKMKKTKRSLLRSKHSVRLRRQQEGRLKKKHNFHPKRSRKSSEQRKPKQRN